MIDEPRILILTLYSGENEFDQLLKSLQLQSYANWEHKVFKHLPNKEAHESLYQEIMEHSGEFDLFIKLDADMVFMDSESLKKIVGLFRETEGLDHLQMVVHDWYSDSLIGGLHIYSNKAVWKQNDDRLFVDYPPSIPGKRWVLWDDPSPLVYHSPNPSPLEAFHFGIHRALKVFQPGRKSFRRSNAKLQWEILKKVWDHFIRSRDRRLGLVLLGASYVIQGKVKQPRYGYTLGKLARSSFEKKCSQLSAEDLYRILSPRWGKPIVREMSYNLRVLPRILLSKVVRFKDLAK